MTLFAFCLVLVSAVFHAGWNFLARKVTGDYVVMWLAQLAALVIFFPPALFVICFGDFHFADSGTGVLCMIASGLVHSLYFFLLARAYQQGEISVVYPIARGSGIGLTALLAAFFLQETISQRGAMGIGFIFVGILFFCGLQVRSLATEPGVGRALWVGVTIVGYSLVDKIGVAGLHPVVYLWGMTALAALPFGLFVCTACRGRIRATLTLQWPAVALIGLGSGGTYLMILFAFQLDLVSYIVALREFSVVIGAAMGFSIFKERLTRQKVVGMVAITLGLLLIKAA